MSGPLTVIERAKVAVAVGATMQISTRDLADLVRIVDSAHQSAAAADQCARAAERVYARGRAMCRLGVVFLGIGFGTLIAGLIL